MAIPKTVSGQVVGPDGSGRSAQVTITLSAQAFVNGNEEVDTEPIIVMTSANGVWYAQLWSNLDLTPATTFYTVQEKDMAAGVVNTYTIHVPQSAGPFNAASISP